MIERAINKINDEIKKENNPYVKVIGQYLLSMLKNNEDVAEKILSADKSIMKSLEEMRKEAEKVKVGNMAILSDEEGFAIVLKYFGIEKEGSNNIDDMKVIDFKAKKEEKKEELLNISLDDYL